ncbi:MAG: hypothetical protein L3J39_19245 [Verrucomicrobiales bacterium]|nr:hypothetical protein [Verrucomicrobiales bacterium]
MPERPALTSTGIIRQVREEQRLFDIEMPNGYHALAVLHHHDPAPPSDPIGKKAQVSFSPYDMSRCKILKWVE